MELDAVKYNTLFNHQEMLSKEEELSLMKQAGNGNVEAKEKLVMGNLRYAAYFAKNLKFSNLEFDDLYNECVMGLIQAADHVDGTMKNRFTTYANYWIMATTTKAMNQYGSDIILPEKKYRLMKKVRGVYGKYMEKFNNEEICRELTGKKMNISEETVSEILNISEKATSLEGLFEKEDNQGSYENVISGSSKYNVEDNYVKISVQNRINKIVKQLPEKEADVLIKHFGLDGKEPMSFSEIGNSYGLTKGWANDMEKKARKHLMEYADELEELIA